MVVAVKGRTGSLDLYTFLCCIGYPAALTLLYSSEATDHVKVDFE